MKTFIDSSFWSDSDVESEAAGGKLVALWLMTNSSTNLLGICNASPKRFAFETGLPEQALAKGIKGMPRSFIGVGKGIFIKNFIRYQYGHGDKLLRNNFFVRLRREFEAIKEPVLREAILAEYPEFASPCQGGGKGGEGKGREGTKKKVQKDGTSTPKRKKSESLKPTDPQAIQLAACVGRKADTPWNEPEINLWRKLKRPLDQQQLDRVSLYYAKNRKRDTNYCRRDLKTLLGNYAGECDRANAWCEKFRKRQAPPTPKAAKEEPQLPAYNPEVFQARLQKWKEAGRPFDRVSEFFPAEAENQTNGEKHDTKKQ